MNGRLTDITETGYIWQKREKQEEDLPEAYSPEIQRLIDALNEVPRNPGMAMVVKDIKKQMADKEYFARLAKDLEKEGALKADIDKVLDDPLTAALRNLRYMSDARQDELFKQQPEVQDLAEYAEDARDYIVDRLERYLDSPVKRFIDDVVIPLAILGSILAADIMAPELIPATIPELVAATGRLAVPIGRVAQALGAAEIYRELTNFFKKIEGDKSGKDSGASKDRIQSTKQDADRYINGLKEKGVLGEKQKSLDGREYYEVTQKTNHNGVRFRKGDYVSRDTLHHEWEWFRGKGYHKGAINSKTGEHYKGGTKDRILKVK
jgi:hypothetical protein